MDFISEELVQTAEFRYGTDDSGAPQKEAVALLVDCSLDMFQQEKSEKKAVDEPSSGFTHFERAVEVVTDIIRHKCASGGEGGVCIILYNSMQASSTSRFDGVIVLHKAARAGLRLLECIKSLGLIKRWPEEQWDTDIVGHMNVIQGIRDAMAMSVLEFSEYWHEETSDLRCIFFTRVHKLHMASEDEKVIRDIKTLINCRRIYTQTLSNSMNIDMKKKRELKSVGNTELTRSSLVRESSLFGQEGSPSCRAHTFSAMDVSRLLLSVGGVKHTSSVLPLTLGDAQLGMSDETVTMPCQLATMASSCWPKFHGLVSVVDAWDSTKLSQADVTGAKYDATYDFEDDVLHDGVNLYKYPKRANVKPGYELAPLGLTPSEIDACLKPSSTKSLRILGFQPRSWIKAVWQIKDPLFLSLAGNSNEASSLFASLHWAMCERNAIALCVYVKSDHAEPRLVALIPMARGAQLESEQKEIRHSGTVFSFVELPFADDMRVIDKSLSCRTNAIALPHEEEALALLEEFGCQDPLLCVSNPHIKHHFNVLECIATGSKGTTPSVNQVLNKHLRDCLQTAVS